MMVSLLTDISLSLNEFTYSLMHVKRFKLETACSVLDWSQNVTFPTSLICFNAHTLYNINDQQTEYQCHQGIG